MIKTSTNINKTNNHLSPQFIIKKALNRPRHMSFEIQVRLMGPEPTPLNESISNNNTDINKRNLYTPAPRKGRGGILLYLCPSVQDIFRRIFLSNC